MVKGRTALRARWEIRMFRSATSISSARHRAPALTSAPARLVVLAALVLAGCQPTVKVEAPDKPIVINLNVKIEQEVRVRVEKDVENLLDERKDLF